MTLRMILAASVLLLVSLAGCTDNDPPEEPENNLGVDEGLEATDSTGVIRGVVVSPSITPIEGVSVTIRSTGDQAMSNADGEFSFSDLEPGTYFLRAEKLGHNATDSSVEVVAGVDRPPIVRILLESNLAALPMVEILEFEGFLQCSVTAVVIGGNICGLVDIVTGQPLDSPLMSYELAAQPTFIQSEMVWESTQPLGGELQLMYSWSDDACEPFLCDEETAGTSPLVLSLDEEGVDTIGFGRDHDLMIRVFNQGLAESSGTLGLTFEQRFTVFTTVFYGFSPDPGYLYIEDGEPTPPS